METTNKSFFLHENRSSSYIETFFDKVHEYFKNNIRYILMSFLLLFQINLVETASNFRFFFTDVIKSKRNWMIGKNKSFYINIQELKTTINVYVDLISSFTVENPPDPKLKKYSKLYDHYVKESFIKEIISQTKCIDDFVSIEGFLIIHYETLSDTNKVRENLEEIFKKSVEKKSSQYNLEIGKNMEGLFDETKYNNHNNKQYMSTIQTKQSKRNKKTISNEEDIEAGSKNNDISLFNKSSMNISKFD